MNTKIKSNPATDPLQIASQIAEVIINKGTAFAGFDYKGKRRNVIVGSDLSKFVTGNGRGNWGTTFTNGALIAYRGKMFLQAVENNVKDRQLKRFDLSKASNFVIG